MKRPAYTIQIENPCNENWSKMESTGTGKFCSHCQHSVIDFSRLTDSQVIALIEKTQGEICGRFNNHQLNRIMQQTGPTPNPVLYKILAAMLLLAAPAASEAQTTKPQTEIVTGTKNKQPDNHPTKKDLADIVFSGVVLDETSEPIPFAGVVLYNGETNTQKGVQTDFDGNFKFTVPVEVISDSSYLKVLYVGLKPAIVPVNANSGDLKVVMSFDNNNGLVEINNMTVGKMVITPERKATATENKKADCDTKPKKKKQRK